MLVVDGLNRVLPKLLISSEFHRQQLRQVSQNTVKNKHPVWRVCRLNHLADEDAHRRMTTLDKANRMSLVTLNYSAEQKSISNSNTSSPEVAERQQQKTTPV